MQNQPAEFLYGRRQVVRYDKTGQPSYSWHPLERADFLNPREGDEFAHGERHDQIVRTLRRLLRYRFRYNPATVVLSQVKLVWDRPDLAQPAPDLTIVTNVSEPERVRTVFDISSEQTWPSCIIEVTSPLFAELDLVEKVAVYAQAGVAEYLIVDPCTQPQLAVLGYRLAGDSYAPIEADARGWLWSGANRVWLGVDAADNTVRIYDGRTSQPIVPDPEYDEGAAAARAEATFRAQSIAAQLDFFASGE